MTTLLDQAIVSATNFLTGVVVARSCSRSELGLYSLGSTVVVLLLAVQSSTVSIPYTIYGARQAEADRAAYTGSTLVHQLCLAAGSLACLAALGPLAAARAAPPGLAHVLPLLACAVPFLLAREYGRQLMFARLRSSPALLLDAVVLAVQIPLLLSLARWGALSARSAFAAAGVACALPVSVWLAIERGRFELRRDRFLPDLRANWVAGKWSLAAALAGIAGAQLYPWLLSAARGTDAAGVLAACMGVTCLANPLVLGLGNFLAPQAMQAFAEGGMDAVRPTLRMAMFVLVLAMGIVCPALFLCGGKLLTWIYGARYEGYGLTVGVLSLAQAVDVVTLPANCVLFLTDRPDATFKGNVLVLALTLAVGFALVRGLGPLGVAVGLLAGNVLSSAYRWWECGKRMRASTAGMAARPCAGAP
jgi:O-antigen/teichoic acid export membrane protein